MSKAAKLKISIIIPAYNEALRIVPSLKKIGAYLARRRWSHEIIVVDDGSRDNTSQVVNQVSKTIPGIRLIDNVVNLGKGASIRNGVMEARAEAVLFTDADLSTPIEELDHFLPQLGQRADMVIGSRALERSQIRKRQPLFREAMGKVFNLFVRLVAVRGISDTQCGFKLFTRELGQRVFALQQVPRFGFDVEMIYLAKKLGYRVLEVPVAWENSPDSTVSTLSGAQAFWDLMRIRFNDWTGKYTIAKD